MSPLLIAYVPSPHAGYLKLFRKYKGSTLFVLGSDFIKEFKPLVRNLPAVEPAEAAEMIDALEIFSEVRILTLENLAQAWSFDGVVMPDEDVSHALAEKYFKNVPITFDGSWRLRWDWGAATANNRPEVETTISAKDFDRRLMARAKELTYKSPDWWRQVAALLVKDGKVELVAFNRHMPSEQTAYLMGDPRSNFEAGQHIDVSVALHAEAGIFAEAAKRGLATLGSSLYVTTFPCPPCAASIAAAGIKRLYYIDGYSRVEGAEVLRTHGVEIIRVEMQDAPVPA